MKIEALPHELEANSDWRLWAALIYSVVYLLSVVGLCLGLVAMVLMQFYVTGAIIIMVSSGTFGITEKLLEGRV